MDEDRNNIAKKQSGQETPKAETPKSDFPSVSQSKISLLQSRRQSRARHPTEDIEGPEPLNVALNYGLEDDHANRQTARVNLIKHPQNRKEKMPIIIHPETPVTTARTKPSSLGRSTEQLTSQKTDPGSTVTGQMQRADNGQFMSKQGPAPIIAVPLEREYEIKVHRSTFKVPTDLPSKEDPKDVPKDVPKPALKDNNRLELQRKQSTSYIFNDSGKVNESNNTDISFQPRKMFATKATNTSESLSLPATTTAQQKQLELKPYTSTMPPGVFALDDCFNFAVSMIKSAGAFAVESGKSKGPITYTVKENQFDLKTHTNSEIEQIMVTAIHGKYPNHKIISENSAVQTNGQVTLTDDHTWIIDPIDGTMNFVHHFPFYCISVAFLLEKETKFGIVYNPPLEEMYTAKKDGGAYLNNRKLNTSSQSHLKEAMVLQDCSYGINDSLTQTYIANSTNLINKTHALRSIGSTAMGLAMVAAGMVDALYFFGMHVWDIAAGIILVTEAGGSVVDPAGVNVDIMSRRVLAACSQNLAYQLSVELTQNYPSPRDDEARTQANKRDFNEQTEFTDSSLSISSSEHSTVDKDNKTDVK